MRSLVVSVLTIFCLLVILSVAVGHDGAKRNLLSHWTFPPRGWPGRLLWFSLIFVLVGGPLIVLHAVGDAVGGIVRSL